MNKWLKYYLPNIWEGFLILLVFFFVGSVLAGAFIKVVLGGVMPDLDMTSLYIIPVIPVFVYIYIRSYSSYKSAKVFDVENGLAKAPKIKVNTPVTVSDGRKLPWWAVGILLLFGTIALGYVLDPIMSRIELPEAIKAVYEKMDFSHPSALLSIVVLAPLCEEFIFRGTVLRGITAKHSPAVAIAVSALLFGIIHLNFFQGVAAFLLGLFIGFVYYKTHSIWAAIFVHFVNNGFSFLMAALLPKECATMHSMEILNYYQVSDPQTVYVIIVAVSAVIAALCIWLLYKYLPKVNTFKALKTAEIVYE